MFDITYLLQTLDRTILEQRIVKPEVPDFSGIILLKNQSKLLEQYLYVGYYSDGIRMLGQCAPNQCITMFLSAEDVNHTQIPTCGCCNVVVSALDLIDLYNRINIIIQNYHYWTSSLREFLCSGQPLPNLLTHAADMLKAQIYVMNPGYKVIERSETLYFEDPLSCELHTKGYLSFANIRLLQEALETTAAKENSCLQIQLNGHSYQICPIYHETCHLAVVLLAINPQVERIDYKHLLWDLSATITSYLLQYQEPMISQDALCAAFLEDIIQEHLTDSAEIQDRIQELPYPVKPFCCIVLIQFDAEKLPKPPFGFIIQELKEIFPETNMAVCQNQILILHSQENRPSQSMNFDYDKLRRFLEHFHAYAGISNASRNRMRLRTLYTLAAAAIRLGRALHRFSPDERVFSYEDYSMYYIIDLCAKQYMEDHHHDDLIYLIHPSIIKICRYDAKHHSNLRDVLFYYLLCGCSLNRTAQIMYMHRNTVLNKLNKITELAEIPLEDGYTRHRMIMSCLIMRYYEEYMHKTTQL